MELLNLKFQILWIISVTLACIRSSSEIKEDTLKPYNEHHGPVHRRLPDTQECQHNRYGNTTYSLHPAHVNQSDFSQVVDIHHKLAEVGEYSYMKRNIDLRFQQVYNPERTISILEPEYRGSCEGSEGVRASVQETANKNKCVFAANAGFFDTQSGKCLGNIVSDGRLVQDSGGIQNVHFGITKEGQIFTGYLSEIELVTLQFKQLVGGVIWLLRDGEVYVDESRDIECPDTEETGTLDRFIRVVSARSAVGHNAQGHVLMVQVDGKTDRQGVDLYEFATVLKEMGFVNAINLDGGGSATSVVNGIVVNYPSDSCVNSTWNCARAVSTILCVHAAECLPDPHCSGHGQCESGRCVCQAPWTGEACNTLACPSDCSGHGQCLEAGCLCHAGWRGDDCSKSCEVGTYGANCSRVCSCLNNATCDPASGLCGCKVGFVGKFCEAKCDYGWYGEHCQTQCDCPQQCSCDHVTGVCSNATDDTEHFRAGHCLLMAEMKKSGLVPDQTDQLLLWKRIAVAGGVVAVISIGINVMLAAVLCSTNSRGCRQKRHPYQSRASSRTDVVELVPLHDGDDSSFAGSSEEADDDMDMFQKRFIGNRSLRSGKR